MKTLQELQEKVNSLNFTATKFVLEIREDYHDNASDANLSESESFDNLNDALTAYNEALSTINEIETDYSEFKTIELNAWDEDDYEMEILIEDTYILDYTEADYGKYKVSYRPTNNGIEGIRVEVIDSRTKFEVSNESKFSTKIIQFDTETEVVDFIYTQKLYISQEDAQEIFDMSL